MTSNEVCVVVAICRGRTIPWRHGTPCGVAKNRLNDDPFAILKFADNFMTGNEWKGNEVLKIGGGVSIDESEIGTANPRQSVPNLDPP